MGYDVVFGFVRIIFVWLFGWYLFDWYYGLVEGYW